MLIKPAFYFGLGYIVLDSLALVPQVNHAIENGKVEDIGPVSLGIRILSQTVFGVYGYMISDYFIIASVGLPILLNVIKVREYILLFNRLGR